VPLGEALGQLALFADLSPEALEALGSAAQEEHYGEGEWILRQGEANAGLRVLLDGEVAVVINGIDRAMLHSGMFFGEISALLDQPAGADVVARSPIRCAHIHRDVLVPFLLDNPSVTLRLLQAEARRLDLTNRWLA
jgi:CRP-like cAMP-binding protein